MVKMKSCSDCGINKPTDHFYSNSKFDDRKRQTVCKECKLTKSKQRYSCGRVKAKVRNQTLKRKYGISLQEYDYLYKRQNGLCAICKEVNLNGWQLAIDHDHKTGKVRGLLCSSCNTGLGLFKDSIENLNSAVDYLERSEYSSRIQPV